LAKKRVVKDYDAVPEEILRAAKIAHPNGYETSLISYTDAKGKKVSALPFETDDTYYLIRMTSSEAKRLVKEDEDFDDEGHLREDFAEPAEVVDEEVEGTDEDMEEFNDNQGEDDHIIVTRRRADDDEEDFGGGGMGGGGGMDDDY
jgi:DNA-directed RNA polymerase subunit delta